MDSRMGVGIDVQSEHVIWMAALNYVDMRILISLSAQLWYRCHDHHFVN